MKYTEYVLHDGQLQDCQKHKNCLLQQLPRYSRYYHMYINRTDSVSVHAFRYHNINYAAKELGTGTLCDVPLQSYMIYLEKVSQGWGGGCRNPSIIKASLQNNLAALLLISYGSRLSTRHDYTCPQRLAATN